MPTKPVEPGGRSAVPRRRGVPALSPVDWADAALVDIGKKGIEALAVEPLAARLRVTKGSFYWHFRDRRALLKAALERWEFLGTELVITKLDELPDPRVRLRRLLDLAFNGPLEIELAILSAADDPLAGPIVKRVMWRRLGYLSGLFRAAGLSARQARTASTHALAAYLGAQHILHTAPQYFRPRDRQAFTANLAATLLLGRP